MALSGAEFSILPDFQMTAGYFAFSSFSAFATVLPPEVAKQTAVLPERSQLSKRLYDARGSVPPDRKANEDGVIPAHILRQRGDLRTGSRIVHFFAAAAVLVHPVEICAGIGYSGSKLKDIRTRGFGELLRGIFGDAARGKIDDYFFLI